MGKRHSLQLEFSSVHSCVVMLTDDAAASLHECWREEWRQAAIIGDATVIDLYSDAMRQGLQDRVEQIAVLDFPPGEPHKTRQTKQMLEDGLLAQGFGRQACIVALGGGISLDLAGFVAATYMRGIPYVNVPTSLLAQVDASIGGKTGLNVDQGKNLVGAIHQPAAVIIDRHYLQTLPGDQWANGLAEMVKHAVIADRDLFCRIESHTEQLRRPGALDHQLLRRCLEIKGSIVQQDEHEQGRRAQLNFGHTVGHALEKASAHRLSHGLAVAWGMLVEARLACSLCSFPEQEVTRLRRLLSNLEVIDDPPRIPVEQLIDGLTVDKKRKDGEVRMALPERIGSMAVVGGEFTAAVPAVLVQQTWEELVS